MPPRPWTSSASSPPPTPTRRDGVAGAREDRHADRPGRLAPPLAYLTPTHVLRGRCKSEPAVTVRDPTAASGRLTRWNSWTDGESPDGRQHVDAGPPGRARSGRLASPARPEVPDRTSPGARPHGLEQEAGRWASSPAPRR